MTTTDLRLLSRVNHHLPCKKNLQVDSGPSPRQRLWIGNAIVAHTAATTIGLMQYVAANSAEIHTRCNPARNGR